MSFFNKIWKKNKISSSEYFKNKDSELYKNLLDFRNTHNKEEVISNGIKIPYYIGGRENKNAILLFHGGTVDAEFTFNKILRYEKDFKVISPETNNISSIQDFLDGINTILEKENIKDFFIITGSGGGTAAQIYFHRYFNRIKGMILSVALPPMPEHEISYRKAVKLLKILPEFLFKKVTIKKLTTKYDLNEKGIEKYGEKVQFLMDYYIETINLRITKKDIINQMKMMVNFCNEAYKPEYYKDWNGKILLMTSNSDSGFKYHERLKNQYPNIKEIIYEDSGHLSSLVREDEFNKEIDKILSNLIK